MSKKIKPHIVNTKIKEFFSNLRHKIRSIRLPKIKRIEVPKIPKIKFNRQEWRKKPVLLKILAGLILIYLLTGVGFAIATYKKCPSEQEKKCLRDNKSVKFAASIYPFPAAWAGWNPIWAKNFFQQMDYMKRFAEKSEQELPDRANLGSQLLDQMVDLTIIKKQAAKNKIKVTKEDIDQAYKEIADQSGGQEEVKKVLQDLYGMNEEDFRNLIKDQLYKQKMQEKFQELEVQIHARHILIKDETRAKEVLEKAKKGEKSFEDLAKEFSEDTGSRDQGGDLGWFGRGKMVKEFEDAAFAIEVGKIKDDLTKSEFGYHIIKVDERKGSIDKSFVDWFNEIKSKYKIRKWLS